MWLSDEMKELKRGLQYAVILFTLVNFLLKLAVIIMLGVTQRDSLNKLKGGLQLNNAKSGAK
jgi:hypothetical protein